LGKTKGLDGGGVLGGGHWKNLLTYRHASTVIMPVIPNAISWANHS
jgi:hypothetical protein